MDNKGTLTFLIVVAAVSIRWCVSLNPYSGAGKPPMFGDYEAQRHWMEMTYHLPVKEWYHNTSTNDLQYWGLDYPPLTAYHSWLCGYVADKVNPDWVALQRSRGHESEGHKLFMRYTVLVADLLVYIPAVIAFFLWTVKDRSNIQLLAFAAVTLLYPGLVLIDYGHFQYNCISLGFTLWAVVAMATNHELLGSVAFVLALNYKQMELYHAVPFFCYLLGRCLWSKDEIRLWKLAKIGVFVIGTFALCWLPFLHDIDHIQQVIHRIFPFARGLFEDKVSNIWCSLNVIIKLKNLLSQPLLIRLSLASTLICLAPSAVNLLLNPSIQKLKYALVNSSLVFFLFSYQVHEKSILIAALPVCLLIHEQPFVCTWFLLISVFSMLPLLIKDGLILATIPLMVLFYTGSKVSQSSWVTPPTSDQRGQSASFRNFAFWCSILGVIALTACSLVIQSPQRFPDLWPVLVSIYSCGHFILFLISFNYLQFTSEDIGQTSAIEGAVQSKLGGRDGHQGVGNKTKKGGKRKQKTNKVD
ncbi:dolichyl pyrophosphate Man9GlcNAc2 alpha-1,3-glucosyltransferase [Strongylocentrotus purpuratus]|uniref:Alpha-1,3-glucosyltransferase n=1 Tax=Strongylocentrotus purpuratus TaxID=7668 RepID=A0A7M7PN60_STRPU|nr:dolichyl pyrophosphate Man9GlcNAc2 alpha-1,3-glucosyltransferase [Strongylocentrotus purpuratus]